MFLQSLSLQNFRSFSKKEFAFKSKITLLVGPNAIGKTNVLEAIYLLATGKSFRAGREEEMIRNEEELARINATIAGGKLEIILTKGMVNGKGTAKKIYKVNGVGKRWKDFVGNLPCVLFRPEDIDLILGSPSVRRDYLNFILEQVDWQYRACHLVYQKGLRQRNKLLERIREHQAQLTQLAFWNQLLIKNGTILTQKREALIAFFNEFLTDLEIFYDHSIISLERLEKYQQAELALGVTLVGPHRDDITILKIKNVPQSGIPLRGKKLKIKKNLAIYGSRGEQRMAILNLKRAEQEFIRQKTGKKPLMLLDDIFSELDDKNSHLVVKLIENSQTVITDTQVQQFFAKNKINLINLKIENQQ